MNIRETIRTADMGRPQFLVVALCIVLTMIDGFDSVVMAFVAPHLAHTWKLGHVEVGYLLSGSVLGMALGAIFISPLADRIGRRRHIVSCLVLLVVGMGLSGFAVDVKTLALSRVFAGLFIGAIIPSINVVVSEYASDRRRGTVMGIYGIGLPLGSALGGALASPLIAAQGWQAPFFCGAALTFGILILSIFLLPESIEYLIERHPTNALARLNRIAARMRLPQMTLLPAPREAGTAGSDLQALIGGVMLRRTIYLILGFTCLQAAFFFGNTWTPKLLSDVSGNPALGGLVGVLILTGGVIGALLFAGLASRYRPRVVTAVFVLCGSISYLLFSSQMHNVSAALVLAVCIGVFANGGATAFYAISPSVYPTTVRATGVGWMVGFARASAVGVPLAIGYLLQSGWTPSEFYLTFGLILAVGAVFAWLLDRTYEAEPNRGAPIALDAAPKPH